MQMTTKIVTQNASVADPYKLLAIPVFIFSDINGMLWKVHRD